MIVYRGTFATTSGTGTKTVTLDTPVPVGQSYPRITWTAPGTVGSYGRQPAIMLTDEVDGYYTKLTFEWLNTSTGDVSINWEVVTGDELTVQSGREVFAQSKVVAITTVDLGESYIVLSTSADVNMATMTYVAAEYTAVDEITLTRQPSDGTVLVCWYAVTMAGATVISGSSTMSKYAEYVNATIGEVDLTKSFLQFSYNVIDRPVERLLVEGYFNSTTQLEFRCNDSGSVYNDIYVKWFVITHDKLKVQYGQTTMASGNTNTINETIDAAKPDRAFGVISARNTSTDSDRDVYGKVLLGVTANYATLQRLSAVSTTTASWFVAEWTAPAAPENLSPTTAIMPTEENTFTWTLPAGLTQTGYELQYRIAGGVWTSTGEITSSVTAHKFYAGTFIIAKDYEWQVRYWATGEVDPSDWSAIAEFDTYNPVIQNLVPYPDSSIRVDIRDFGGRLKSPYGRDIQLTIEIADNAAYTSATTYTLPVVESGTEAIMQHAIQEGGTWYVRMTATDTESLQTVLEYSFFAGQFIQFITLPTVRLEPQQATHVTVRVRDTTTEYTAVIDPAPPADKVVEQLFYIQAGTQSTCQAVAEAFLAKLGRPQIRVSGVIPLTVTLQFGQKVRVKIPDAGIDEEMILQRKEHHINEREAATYVDLGDIIVSDNELLARILERGD